jgi:hypothetical protein
MKRGMASGVKTVIIEGILAVMLCVFFGGGLSSPVSAEEKQGQTREERLYQVKLREAELALSRAAMRLDRYKREHEEAQALFKEDVIALQETNEARRKYESAELAYKKAKIYLQKMKLYFLRVATHISIVEAKKYRTAKGRRIVEITLENTSNIAQGMTLHKDLSKEEVAALLEIQNLIISISTAGGRLEQEEGAPSEPYMEEGEEYASEEEQTAPRKGQEEPKTPSTQVSISQGVVVGEPYEIIVPSLKFGQRKILIFRLLQDLEEVGVTMSFLETQRTTSVVLRKESLQDVPTINSAQFSQEGGLGAKLAFDIMLERLAEEEKTFRLVVINFPQEMDFSFVDPATQASLTQVKFTQETSKQSLNLVIAIPEKLSRELVDRTIEFYVFVVDAEAFKTITKLRQKYGERPFELEDINRIKGNKVMLELIPRGVGELETIVAKSYEEIKTGEDVTVRVDVFNTGTLPVQDVKMEVSLPYEWEAKVIPPLIQEIEAGEKEPVHIRIMPPKDLGVGEYDVYVEAEGQVENEKIESSEKNITIRVAARAKILKNVALISGVILFVVGVAVFSIKISRR